MGNYRDPDAVRLVDIGACRCPVEVSPHARDTATVREQLGAGAKIAIRDSGYLAAGGAFFSEGAAKLRLVQEGVVDWNLLLPTGEQRPVNGIQIAALDMPTLDRLADELDPSLKHDPLPKARAARSRGTSRGSRSSTRTTRTTSPRTTT